MCVETSHVPGERNASLPFPTNRDGRVRACRSFVIFDTVVPDPSISLLTENTVAYELWVNDSMQFANDESVRFLGLSIQSLIDAAIASVKSNKPASISVSISTFRMLDGNVAHHWTSELVPLLSGGFVVLSMIAVPFLLVHMMSSEKEKRLLIRLRIAGLNEGAHLCAWFFWMPFLSAITSWGAALMAVHWSGVWMFANTPVSVLFFIFLAYGVAMSSLGLFIASVAPTVRWAQGLAGFIFVLIAGVMQFWFARQDVMAMQDHCNMHQKPENYPPFFASFYAPDTPWIWSIGLFLAPWFHTGKALSVSEVAVGRGEEKRKALFERSYTVSLTHAYL
jgi:hypothetical protein